MVSKNNRIAKMQQVAERQSHFGIRKLTIGAASVLLGTTLWLGTNANVTHAEDQDANGNGDADQAQKSENSASSIDSNTKVVVAPSNNQNTNANSLKSDISVAANSKADLQSQTGSQSKTNNNASSVKSNISATKGNNTRTVTENAPATTSSTKTAANNTVNNKAAANKTAKTVTGSLTKTPAESKTVSDAQNQNAVKQTAKEATQNSINQAANAGKATVTSKKSLDLSKLDLSKAEQEAALKTDSALNAQEKLANAINANQNTNHDNEVTTLSINPSKDETIDAKQLGASLVGGAGLAGLNGKTSTSKTSQVIIDKTSAKTNTNADSNELNVKMTDLLSAGLQGIKKSSTEAFDLGSKVKMSILAPLFETSLIQEDSSKAVTTWTGVENALANGNSVTVSGKITADGNLSIASGKNFTINGEKGASIDFGKNTINLTTGNTLTLSNLTISSDNAGGAIVSNNDKNVINFSNVTDTKNSLFNGKGIVHIQGTVKTTIDNNSQSGTYEQQGIPNDPDTWSNAGYGETLQTANKALIQNYTLRKVPNIYASNVYIDDGANLDIERTVDGDGIVLRDGNYASRKDSKGNDTVMRVANNPTGNGYINVGNNAKLTINLKNSGLKGADLTKQQQTASISNLNAGIRINNSGSFTSGSNVIITINAGTGRGVVFSAPNKSLTASDNSNYVDRAQAQGGTTHTVNGVTVNDDMWSGHNKDNGDPGFWNIFKIGKNNTFTLTGRDGFILGHDTTFNTGAGSNISVKTYGCGNGLTMGDFSTFTVDNGSTIDFESDGKNAGGDYKYNNYIMLGEDGKISVDKDATLRVVLKNRDTSSLNDDISIDSEYGHNPEIYVGNNATLDVRSDAVQGNAELIAVPLPNSQSVKFILDNVKYVNLQRTAKTTAPTLAPALPDGMVQALTKRGLATTADGYGDLIFMDPDSTHGSNGRNAHFEAYGDIAAFKWNNADLSSNNIQYDPNESVSQNYSKFEKSAAQTWSNMYGFDIPYQGFSQGNTSGTAVWVDPSGSTAGTNFNSNNGIAFSDAVKGFSPYMSQRLVIIGHSLQPVQEQRTVHYVVQDVDKNDNPIETDPTQMREIANPYVQDAQGDNAQSYLLYKDNATDQLVEIERDTNGTPILDKNGAVIPVRDSNGNYISDGKTVNWNAQDGSIVKGADGHYYFKSYKAPQTITGTDGNGKTILSLDGGLYELASDDQLKTITTNSNEIVKDGTVANSKGFANDQNDFKSGNYYNTYKDGNLYVVYRAVAEKAHLNVVDDFTGETLKTYNAGGNTNTDINFGSSPQTDINNYLNNGYKFVSVVNDDTKAVLSNDNYQNGAAKFGQYNNDPNTDQNFTVHLRKITHLAADIQEVNITRTIERDIKYKNNTGNEGNGKYHITDPNNNATDRKNASGLSDMDPDDLTGDKNTKQTITINGKAYFDKTTGSFIKVNDKGYAVDASGSLVTYDDDGNLVKGHLDNAGKLVPTLNEYGNTIKTSYVQGGIIWKADYSKANGWDSPTATGYTRIPSKVTSIDANTPTNAKGILDAQGKEIDNPTVQQVVNYLNRESTNATNKGATSEDIIKDAPNYPKTNGVVPDSQYIFDQFQLTDAKGDNYQNNGNDFVFTLAVNRKDPTGPVYVYVTNSTFTQTFQKEVATVDNTNDPVWFGTGQGQNADEWVNIYNLGQQDGNSVALEAFDGFQLKRIFGYGAQFTGDKDISDTWGDFKPREVTQTIRYVDNNNNPIAGYPEVQVKGLIGQHFDASGVNPLTIAGYKLINNDAASGSISDYEKGQTYTRSWFTRGKDSGLIYKVIENHKLLDDQGTMDTKVTVQVYDQYGNLLPDLTKYAEDNDLKANDEFEGPYDFQIQNPYVSPTNVVTLKYQKQDLNSQLNPYYVVYTPTKKSTFHEGNSETREVTRTINYYDGTTGAKMPASLINTNPVVQTSTLTRTAIYDENNTFVGYGTLNADGSWTPSKGKDGWTINKNSNYWNAVVSKVLSAAGYKPARLADGTPIRSVAGEPVNDSTKDQIINIYYDHDTTPINPKNPDDKDGWTKKALQKQVTRHFHYVFEDGTTAASHNVSQADQTVIFNGSGYVDKVTGELVNVQNNQIVKDANGNIEKGVLTWTSDPANAILPEVKAKLVEGYTVDGQLGINSNTDGSVDAKQVNRNSSDIDVYVYYKKNTAPAPEQETLTVKYIDDSKVDTQNLSGYNVTITGEAGSNLNYSTQPSIDALVERGFKLVSDGFTKANLGGKMPAKGGNYEVHVIHGTRPVNPDNPSKDYTREDLTKDVTRTIHYVDEAHPENHLSPDVVQILHFEGQGTIDKVTDKLVTLGGADGKTIINEDGQLTWTLADSKNDLGTFAAVTSPEIAGYTIDKVDNDTSKKNVDSLMVDHRANDSEVTVYYKLSTPVKDRQYAEVNYIDLDENGRQIASSGMLSGEAGSKIKYSTSDELAALEKLGYILVHNEFDANGTAPDFDNDSNNNQIFRVTLRHAHTPITPDKPGKPGTPVNPKNPNSPNYPDSWVPQTLTKNINRTISYVFTDGKRTADPVTQTVTYEGKGELDLVTGHLVDLNNDGTIEDQDGQIKWTVKDGKDTFYAVPALKNIDDYTVVNVDADGESKNDVNGTAVNSFKTTKDSNDIKIEIVLSPNGEVPTKEQGSVTIKVHDDTDQKDLSGYGYQTGTVNEGTAVNYANHDAQIKELINKGYVIVSDPYADGEVTKTVPGNNNLVYTIHVKHGTTTVTPKTPNHKPGDPVDPKNPNGPKYPTGTGSDDVVKNAIQTIVYKVYDKNGKEVTSAEPKSQDQKFQFTKSITFDDVTGKIISDSGWNEASHTFNDTDNPVINGYYTDNRTAKGTTVTPTDLTKTITVVYHQIGNIVPVLPNGKTPVPNVPSVPYQNDPTDPTKVVPDEPTPKDPTGDYTPSVPSVTPTKPGTDTPVVYNPVDNGAAFTVHYIDQDENNKVIHTDTPSGKLNDKITYTTSDEIKTLTNLGYVLVSDGFTGKAGTTFTKDNKGKTYDVILKHATIPVDPKNPGKPDQPINPNNPNGPKWPDGTDDKSIDKTITRTITFVDKDGNTLRTPVTQTVHFIATGEIDEVTGKWTKPLTWSPDQKINGMDPKSLIEQGYHIVSISGDTNDAHNQINSVTLTHDGKDYTVTVTYDKNGKIVPVDPNNNNQPIPDAPRPTLPTDPNDPTKVDNGEKPSVPGYKPQTGNPGDPVQPGTNPSDDVKVPYIKNPDAVLANGTVTYYDQTTGKNIRVDPIKGNVGDKITYTTADQIKKLEDQGYKLVSNNFKDGQEVFTKDGNKYLVTLEHDTETINPNNPGHPDQPINPNDPNGPKWGKDTGGDSLQVIGKQIVHYTGAGQDTPADVENDVYFNHEEVIDKVTGKVVKDNGWTVSTDKEGKNIIAHEDSHDFDSIKTPVVKGYVADKASAGKGTISHTNPKIEETVTYKPIGKIVPVDPSGTPIKNAPTPSYINDPNDPTKVIPNEPVPTIDGLTPERDKVTPTDPTKDTPVVYNNTPIPDVPNIPAGPSTVPSTSTPASKPTSPTQPTTAPKPSTPQKPDVPHVPAGPSHHHKQTHGKPSTSHNNTPKPTGYNYNNNPHGENGSWSTNNPPISETTPTGNGNGGNVGPSGENGQTLPNGDHIMPNGEVVDPSGRVVGYVDKNGQVHYTLPQTGENQQTDVAAALAGGAAVAIGLIGLAGVKKRRA